MQPASCRFTPSERTSVETRIDSSGRGLFFLFRVRFALGTQALVVNALKVFEIVQDVVAPTVDVVGLPTESQCLQSLDSPSLLTGNEVVGLATAKFICRSVFRFVAQVSLL